jgi:hypothetical protein
VRARTQGRKFAALARHAEHTAALVVVHNFRSAVPVLRGFREMNDYPQLERRSSVGKQKGVKLANQPDVQQTIIIESIRSYGLGLRTK